MKAMLVLGAVWGVGNVVYPFGWYLLAAAVLLAVLQALGVVSR